MSRKLKTYIVSVFLACGIAMAWGDGPGGQHAHRPPPFDDVSLAAAMHGTFQLKRDAGGVPTRFGDIVECPENSFVLENVMVLDYLAGVCSDISERPCDGRLIRLTEGCVGPGAVDDEPDFWTAGALMGALLSVPIRICFDDSGEGHCTELEEVARGKTTIYRHQLADASTTLATRVARIKHSTPFVFDDKEVRVHRGTWTGVFMNENSVPGPDNCLVTSGCGMAGTYHKVD